MTATQGRAFVNSVVNRDAVLIDRAAQGERAALDELVCRYQERAYQYAFRLTRNTDDAADLVADAFVRVARSIDSFHGHSAFSTWLYRIITNCFFDIRKREARRPTTSLDLLVQTEDSERGRDFPGEGVNVVDYIDRGMKAEILAKAIDRLPSSYRTMIVMYHCENLGYEEIAEALAVPIGTVKSRLNRARISLRDRLAGKVELLTAV